MSYYLASIIVICMLFVSPKGELSIYMYRWMMFEYVLMMSIWCFAVSGPVALHSQAMSMIKFNGLNFTEWSEQIQFHLGVLNLDLSLVNEKSAALTANSSADERSFHDAWERSNRLSLMFMRMTIASNIKATIPNTENAREFLKFVENISKSESADKSRAGTLMAMLTTIKFDGSRSMHEHVTEMINTAAKLKSMGMEVGEKFLVQFIINSLPSEYGPFQMSYNTIKDEWSVNELHSMLIQENET